MYIKGQIKAIHTEPAYANDEIVSIEDNNRVLRKALSKVHGLPSFYMNHYVLETTNGLYIGYNDGEISISNDIAKLPKSKTLNCDFNLTIVIK